MVITQVSKQMSNSKNLSHHHVRILAELCRNSENIERRRLLLRNSKSCLLHSLKNKATREAIWVPALLDVLTSFEKARKRNFLKSLTHDRNSRYLIDIHVHVLNDGRFSSYIFCLLETTNLNS